MDLKIKLKLSPRQLEIFVLDWQTNYRHLSFEEYFEKLVEEIDKDAEIR